MAVKTVDRFCTGGLTKPIRTKTSYLFCCLTSHPGSYFPGGLGGLYPHQTQRRNAAPFAFHCARGEARDTILGRRHQTRRRATLTRCFELDMASDHRPRCGERLRAYIQLNAALRAALDSKKYIRKSREAGRSKRPVVIAGNRQRASNRGRAYKLLRRCRALNMCAYDWEAARGRCGRSKGTTWWRRLSRPIYV